MELIAAKYLRIVLYLAGENGDIAYLIKLPLCLSGTTQNASPLLRVSFG